MKNPEWSNSDLVKFQFGQILFSDFVELLLLRGSVTRLAGISPFGLLFKIYWVKIVAQKSGNILGNFFPKHFIFYFHLNKQFQSKVCLRYFKVLKVFWCRCFGLSNWALMYIFWQMFWLLFPRFGGIFSHSSGHPA